MTRAGPSYVFIGLRSKEDNVAMRYWVDGSTFNYMNWMEGKPTNQNDRASSCVIMSVKDGTWLDTTCQGHAEGAIVGGGICQSFPAQSRIKAPQR
ncbi:unnamed protein product [Gongylonema pulchrum]|uniref:C-type lectin domain-containing protein n=1 Tax=Gongylonema pulchrum TaxID=637853 RepID=A0A183D4L5_9BILA|nr:unnamed protein product [Gongylonema pulchrum]